MRVVASQRVADNILIRVCQVQALEEDYDYDSTKKTTKTSANRSSKWLIQRLIDEEKDQDVPENTGYIGRVRGILLIYVDLNLLFPTQ